MWTAVAPPVDGSAPASRAKHSATLLGGHVYLLGGRNGNLPLKDLWRYSLAEGKWEQLQPAGERPPCLQEHTAVSYRDCIYVFGGEVGFSAGTETPLWVYQVKSNTWRKVRGQKGVAVPRGRRGHTALVHRGAMLVYGGYQDLRGSSSELWAFHFDTESWHLLSGGAGGGGSRGAPAEHPPARHKHSAVLHDDAVWVYGGMTDLQERNDFWRWDTVAKAWTAVRAKPGPGALHSHAACKLPSSMLLFGGERDGHPTNELWRFHFGTETWERLAVPGLKPQPRAESVALAVSELLLQDGSSVPCGGIPGAPTGATQPGAAQLGAARSLRPRGGGSVDRCSGNPRLGGGNRVSPCERKYVFRPTSVNYVDGSGTRCQAANVVAPGGAAPPANGANGTNFLREISKLSQINLSRLSHHKCSYSVLSSSSHDDSTESLLSRQRAGTDAAEEANRASAAQAQPNKVLVKSQSANLISRRNGTQAVGATNEVQDSDEDGEDEDSSSPPPLRSCLPREPVSVPNFSTLSTSTSVCSTALTPVEVTKLVFLDSEDEYENERDAARDRESAAAIPHPLPVVATPVATPASDFSILHQQFQPRPATTPGGGGRRSDSYSSHLLEAGSATTPGGGPASVPPSATSRGIPKSASVRFRTNHLVAELEEASDETVSTSDYASIETVNRISSASNYSMYSKLSPLEHTYDDYSSRFGRSTKAKTPNRDGPFGFCNPNYLGPDIQTILASAGQRKSWHVTTPDGGVNGNGAGPLGDALHRQQFQTYAKLLNSPPDSVLEDATGRSTSRTFFPDLESMELHSISQPATPMTPMGAPMGGHIGPVAPPCFLPLAATAQPAPASERRKKGRASSASRAEGSVAMLTPAACEDDQELSCFGPEPPVPLYMFILGGKEQGQVTVFKRPVSVWRLLLAPNIF